MASVKQPFPKRGTLSRDDEHDAKVMSEVLVPGVFSVRRGISVSSAASSSRAEGAP